MNEFLKKIFEFILSVKFYGPIVAIILGVLINQIINNIIINIKKKNINFRVSHKKEDTIINLIRNLIKYLIIIIVVLIILEIYGINTTSIIASLGIVGVVVGLAFQDTVKNMLSGIFIIFDNRYNVGDIVKINDFTGEVKTLGLLTTKLQAHTGEVFTISNSEITVVINYTESDSLLVIDLGVNYNTDIDVLENALKKLNTKIKKLDNVKGDLNLLGIDSFGSNEIVYRVTVLCKPYTHFGVKREILKIIKKEFDKHKIEIPYNQLDIHLVEDKTNIKKVKNK